MEKVLIKRVFPGAAWTTLEGRMTRLLLGTVLAVMSGVVYSQGIDQRAAACAMRAEIFGAMKSDRDKGVSKAQSRKTAYARVPQKYRRGLDYWIDMTYSEATKKVSPSEYAAVLQQDCLVNG